MKTSRVSLNRADRRLLRQQRRDRAERRRLDALARQQPDLTPRLARKA